jgi:hypothetical protein
MRNLSFIYTLDSFTDGTKDVTRRIWKKQWVKAGDHMMAVEKAQGLKKGEKIHRLGEIEILNISPECLDEIIRLPSRANNDYEAFHGRPETAREGFPKLKPEGFVKFFCKVNNCKPEQTVYRIVFRRVL